MYRKVFYVPCEESCIFPNTLHHYGLWSDLSYYVLTTPACNIPGIPHSTTRGTHPSCSVGRVPQPPEMVMSTIKSPFTTSLALWAYSFDTRTCTGQEYKCTILESKCDMSTDVLFLFLFYLG